MLLPNSLLSALSVALSFLPGTDAQTKSTKRGLVDITTLAAESADFSTWTSSSGLTWYYNYKANPTSQLSSAGLQFVPMFFGKPNPGDTPFNETVLSLVSSGANITHVLSFNEPDGSYSTGGSVLDPVLAAELWQGQVKPLKAKGIKVGAPATIGNDNGLSWLAAFFTACGGLCPVDFYPIHFYGDFGGLASYMGQMQAAYGQKQNATLWVTEWADPNQNLSNTQSAFNTSLEYFDRLPWVERYSYFGSFRSSVSNVGPNVAMLNSDGKLTDIGAWYEGKSATGVLPNAGSRPVISLGLMIAVITVLLSQL